jgi:putative hydrolase of the HAD superfamily
VTVRAVVFDLGGVVFPSPIDWFRSFEEAHGLPHRFLSEVVLADHEHGAWARLERGELTIAEFCTAFETECEAAGHRVDAAALMGTVTGVADPRPEMVAALRALRARALKTAALTNNWPREDGSKGLTSGPLAEVFDVVVESAIEGVRKPDPRIYELVCTRLEVEPSEAVFLDDLGVNLKAARAMGMTTIKVVDPHDALAELSRTLGFPLH